MRGDGMRIYNCVHGEKEVTLRYTEMWSGGRACSVSRQCGVFGSVTRGVAKLLADACDDLGSVFRYDYKCLPFLHWEMFCVVYRVIVLVHLQPRWEPTRSYDTMRCGHGANGNLPAVDLPAVDLPALGPYPHPAHDLYPGCSAPCP